MRLSAICQLGRARATVCSDGRTRGHRLERGCERSFIQSCIERISDVFIMHAMYMYNRSTTPWLGKLQISLSLKPANLLGHHPLCLFDETLAESSRLNSQVTTSFPTLDGSCLRSDRPAGQEPTRVAHKRHELQQNIQQSTRALCTTFGTALGRMCERAWPWQWRQLLPSQDLQQQRRGSGGDAQLR